MYSLLKKLLFRLDPEQAHDLSLCSLKLLNRLGYSKSLVHHPITVMDLTFPNPVGLAAGMDNNGEYVDALSALGFGFIEIGGVTPKPQDGNLKPRLFRLTEQQAIINRKGFCNKGVEYMAQQLEKTNYRGILGINITKNKDTPDDKAAEDYIFCMQTLWKYASYFAINISSPNTPGLRNFQQATLLTPLLYDLKQEQANIADAHKKYIPLVVKISPDLSDNELEELAKVLLHQNIDGVIATNTTTQRVGLENAPYANETGGLSGKPLSARSTEIIRKLHAILQDNIPIIASGGVMDAKSAKEKMDAGAKLVQVYTGFIYKGPTIISTILNSLTT